MNNFQFEHPEYLWLSTIILALTALRIVIVQTDKKANRKIIAPEVIKKLINGKSSFRANVKFILINIAIIFLAVGLANPQLGSKMQESKRTGIDIILAIDISNSMLAQDIKPNRLERSKMAILRLISQLKGDRIGIIAYTAKAYTLLPITTDYGAARMFLDDLNVDFINQQGTSISSAIELARESFGQKEEKNKKGKALIIISDGEDHEEGVMESANAAYEEGIRIYTIGMGLPEGAPIPASPNNSSAGFKKDRDGNTVITKLNENLLTQIATSAGGYFIRASNSTTGLDKIYESLDQLQKEDIETRNFKEYEGWFQIFVLIALALLLMESIIGNKKGALENKFKIFN